MSSPRLDVSVCVHVWGGVCSGSGVGQDESKTSMQKAEELKRNMQQVPVLCNSSLTSHRSAWYLKSRSKHPYHQEESSSLSTTKRPSSREAFMTLGPKMYPCGGMLFDQGQGGSKSGEKKTQGGGSSGKGGDKEGEGARDNPSTQRQASRRHSTSTVFPW